SPLTMARSTLPEANALAASSALGVSTMVSRTGAFDWASLLDSADTSRLASPSSEPTAMVSVVGFAYQRQPNRLAPAISTTMPATRVMRSQIGSLVGSMLHTSGPGPERPLEHDPEKCGTVFQKDHARNKRSERDDDSRK